MPRKSDGKRQPEHCGLPAMAPGDATTASGSPGQQTRLKRHCKEMLAGHVDAAGGPRSRQEPELSWRQHTRQADMCSLSCWTRDMGRSPEQKRDLEMGTKDNQSIFHHGRCMCLA